jgi:hypothetical protein
MAKFDIAIAADVIGPEDPEEANHEPGPPQGGIRGHSTLMRGCEVKVVPVGRGIQPQGWARYWLAALLASSIAHADAVTIAPDAPPRSGPATVPLASLPPSWDLDGLYLWLGPTGAASRVSGQWDSTFGGSATIVRVREHDLLAAIGVSFGASRWAERGGGRVWLDGLVGTELAGHMAGLSAGPILELSDLAHPRAGGSVGLWAFAGVTPFVRVGVVDQLGSFAEIGVHLALPVFRRRPH